MRFSQARDQYINLLPDRRLEDGDTGWQERQQEMEAWYRDLIADPKKAERLLTHDHEPYAAFLHRLSGTVLDLGGGVGIARMFLAPGVEHLVVDPSLDWLGHGWRELTARLEQRSRRDAADHGARASIFIRGAAEYLPFGDRSIDAALAFWILNHVAEPAPVFPGSSSSAEARRTIFDRSGRHGTVMAGSGHTAARAVPGCAAPKTLPAVVEGQETLAEKLRLRRLGEDWPLQRDHLRIRDADIRRWRKGRFLIRSLLTLRRHEGADYVALPLAGDGEVTREWRGDFLSYELEAGARAKSAGR